jgi:hypothetical protein
MNRNEVFFELLEGMRRTGRVGGAVALVLGALLVVGSLSVLPEEDQRGRHYQRQREAVALGVVVGLAAAVGGLWLLVTGGTSSAGARAPEDSGDMADALSTPPLPFSFCVRCPRVVKSWTTHACSRCGSDLVEIRDEAEAEWARGELLARR